MAGGFLTVSQPARRDVRAVVASMLGIAGLVVLALGWQHAAADAAAWEIRYEQARSELDAAAEHVPLLCVPEDLDRPRPPEQTR